MSIIRRIYKQGNSQVISVPQYMWALIGAELGDKIEIEGVPGKRLEITLREKGGNTEVKNKGKYNI